MRAALVDRTQEKGQWIAWPFASVHVAHALQRARIKGFEVPSDMLAEAHFHLSHIDGYLGGRIWQS
jgi:hypothetical protein